MLTILLVFPTYLSLPAFGSGILDLVLTQSFLQSYIVRIVKLEIVSEIQRKAKILQAVSQEAPAMQFSERGESILRPNPVIRGL